MPVYCDALQHSIPNCRLIGGWTYHLGHRRDEDRQRIEQVQPVKLLKNKANSLGAVTNSQRVTQIDQPIVRHAAFVGAGRIGNRQLIAAITTPAAS